MELTPDPSHLATTLMRRLHGDVRRRIHADICAAGYADITPAHLPVFQTPGPDGARPTELAQRTLMTKQSMNHLLAGLEHRGYLERVPSSDDGRGKVLRLTIKGLDVFRIIQSSAAAVQAQWESVIGARRLNQLVDTLAELERAGVGDGALAGPPKGPSGAARVKRALSPNG
jgi:DNA-binding MarR family transcriptional regulator